jgi:protein involved in polysaccharide export with SLBB domain
VIAINRRTFKTVLLTATALAGLLVLLAGCVAGPQFGGGPEEVVTRDFPEADLRPPVYLTPGDVISIEFLYWPELNVEQEIRPDGKVSLARIGHAHVAGMTVEELDTYLHNLYADKINGPDITTVVRVFGNRRVYVGGEVLTPGFIDLTHQMTALEAVMATGGFDKRSANLEDVVVIRHVDGERYAKLLNFNLQLGDPDSDLLLAPRDIVYVSRTTIDEVNQWVDQYINRVIPAPVWTYSVYRQ